MTEHGKELLIRMLNSLPADDIIWDEHNKEKCGAVFEDDYNKFKIRICVDLLENVND